MSENNGPQVYDDEIDLFELFQTLWDGKWLIVLITSVCAALGVGVALYLPNQYTVTAKIAPVGDSGGGGLSALAGQFGGLAGLAGISLPSSGGSTSDLLLEIMQSRQFIGQFIEQNELAPRLLAVTRYDAQTQAEIFEPAIYEQGSATWVEEPPTFMGQIEAFSNALSVNQDRDTAVLEISFKHASPLFAQEVLSLLITRIDDFARERDEARAQQSIEYLQGQLRQTRLAEVQRVLYDMIESQTKTLMLAEVNADYAFQVIDPPLLPDFPSEPKRPLIAALAVVLGGMIGVLWVLIQSFVRNRKERSAD